MKYKSLSILFLMLFNFSYAQWREVSETQRIGNWPNNNRYYHLDIAQLKQQLKKATLTGKNAKSIEIKLPTEEGTIERFAVYSAPVVVAELAAQYDLGSYVGVGIDDPQKYLRFSLSGNDFQSMVIKGGQYQFISPQDKTKTIYMVSSKKGKSETPFVCSTTESETAKQQIQQLFDNNGLNQWNATNFSVSSDRKFRTYRLALSTTAEYTNYFGGVAGALTAINATLTRVNGIFEKDLALRLELQNFPQLIYTNPSTDPYSDASKGSGGDWSYELQKNLTATIGNAAYDIGHLFGASGGGGNAGCIGCVCRNNTSSGSLDKGAGFTSPVDGIPEGDTFDIDFVAHEMGHQLGANHTFSHNIENTGVQVEPGSGSTIMGYAGVTNYNVQNNSDAYFHGVSIEQILANVQSLSCGTSVNVSNTPPTISALAGYTIPHSTAFVLEAEASDAENNTLTYTWEQVDNATSVVEETNGTNTSGASFRSFSPSENPKRYFPKESLVMAGVLTSVAEWESVSKVAREMNFRVTVRDNHPVAEQQQVSYANQKITVGVDGPFKVNTTGQVFYAGVANTLSWDVVNTNLAPYNVSEVKISYTTDGGQVWNTLLESTPNDGAEAVVLPAGLSNSQTTQLKVEAIGNVFYAVTPAINVVEPTSCVVTVPVGILVENITSSSAKISWNEIPLISNYIFEYKKQSESVYTSVSLQEATIELNNLEASTRYDFRVKSLCSNSESDYTTVQTFQTAVVGNCASASESSANAYIQRVEVERFSNASGASTYSDFTGDSFRVLYLSKNGTSYSIRVTPKRADASTMVSVAGWIDFDGDGYFTTSEQILNQIGTTDTEIIASFSLPENMMIDESLMHRMRISLMAGNDEVQQCGTFSSGEVEDYKVVFTNENIQGIKVYPNPFVDYINTTNVADGTVYQLYDASGRLLHTGKVMLNKINLSHLLRATYILKIGNEKGVKIIKQ
ncbi:reprolysin-like metallopeptidase [Bergeyella porcorum]|uniref:reprolysin-like metallopeptidase n=1 Tax=Bergeyella porcorum TaxID=1735111 RepID=UPI0035E87FD1